MSRSTDYCLRCGQHGHVAASCRRPLPQVASLGTSQAAPSAGAVCEMPPFELGADGAHGLSELWRQWDAEVARTFTIPAHLIKFEAQ